ncbi:alpha-ketoglutarate-dependent dioxygenase AlkB family protein [Endozoicomonas ascidiicola]|uniref:alpha-ketoglutarate-dependent dioxygenase AlkB family protein n=1 Tax=Endozoicomonas ascidiicola TaxID=1698521 RepID=UPI0008369D3F|nr:alpha-ketoglutarate-dependent dioxygenase AlkB [Endozoicomonas ascidiicola]
MFLPINVKPELLELEDAEILLWSQIVSEFDADQLYHDLYASLPWQQDTISLYGKTHNVPRLQVWMGDPGRHYQYSGIHLESTPWHSAVQQIRRHIEKLSHHRFNSVLINLYRDGQDSNGWHSDDETELGENPVIASFSLGATRRFRLRHKRRKDLRPYSIDLSSGSLLIMAGNTQHCWHHCLTKTNREVKPRINLTFRKIVIAR